MSDWRLYTKGDFTFYWMPGTRQVDIYSPHEQPKNFRLENSQSDSVTFKDACDDWYKWYTLEIPMSPEEEEMSPPDVDHDSGYQ